MICHSYKVRKSSWQFDVDLMEMDINMDQNMDILDIIFIVNFILSEVEPHPFHLYKSDINKDGQINVDDIILMLNEVL